MAGESLAQGKRIFSRTFRGTYEYLGMIMVLSAVWFFFALAPAGWTLMVMVQVPSVATIVIFMLVVTFLSGPVSAAVSSMTTSLVQKEMILAREIFQRFAKYYLPAAKTTALMTILLGILVVDLIFFITREVAWMQFVGVIWVYFIIFWLLMGQYIFPLIVRREPKTWETLKLAALLALDNLVATFVAALIGLLVTVLSGVLQVPILLFFGGILAFLHSVTLDEVIDKYGRSQESADEIEGEKADE